ncbi:hypothetical protein [Mycobacterium montefiorense]|uniref:Uncharacterized protein n=1 Tax=Mycobacterium montefiorense TaxID=154654 RepID=A0AA37UXP6_9MYCO|nr:hypothetical protein [Mycobacterium montefiorense]GBG35822.1 hypothetical protein MmonteBS_01940 [Mycobacterium montefiorense]GKU35972.1 hypothetical protein NJB14191_33180 [Mycobacterium montefiorense]GKU41578.1 hypothetical protein NJB14192_35620 [Mycobacterium montefiorense]GKU44412.1 hypothetical protein NJB14194_10400 [Mycobacterium montefiorense]GKU51916.1 hypothetical protein NJB14195_31600 [Mycobacterium montefiorense]
MHDLDLRDVVDGLPRNELLVLADEFEVLAGMTQHPIGPWSAWWLWRIRRAMGVHYDPPPAESIGVMDTAERKAIRDDLLSLAERHRDNEGVVAFAVGMVAQLEFSLLDDEQSKADLAAWISAYRRAHPYGEPRDTSRLPRWSNPTDDAV